VLGAFELNEDRIAGHVQMNIVTLPTLFHQGREDRCHHHCRHSPALVAAGSPHSLEGYTRMLARALRSCPGPGGQPVAPAPQPLTEPTSPTAHRPPARFRSTASARPRRSRRSAPPHPAAPV